jgi:hypothetical protein
VCGQNGERVCAGNTGTLLAKQTDGAENERDVEPKALGASSQVELKPERVYKGPDRGTS